MDIDAVTHSHALGCIQGILLEMGMNNCMSPGFQGYHKNNQHGLIEARRVWTTVREPIWGQPRPLHICVTVVYVGLLLVLLAMGTGAVPDSLAGFWVFLILRCLAQPLHKGRNLVLFHLVMSCMPYFLDIQRRSVPFWTEREE